MILRHPGGRRAGSALQASELHEQSLQQEILIRSILVGLPVVPSPQPVSNPNRKCCVNGKVESGALKMSANVTSPTLLNLLRLYRYPSQLEL